MFFQIGERTFDYHLGVLSETCTSEEVEEAKQEFVEFVKRPTKEVSKELKQLYQKVLPSDRKKLISEIKAEYLAFSKQKIEEVVCVTSEFSTMMIDVFQQSNSYFEERLRALRSLGETKATNVYFENSCFISNEHRIKKAYAIASEIIEEYDNGIPTSFPMMASLLQSRKFSEISLKHLYPFSSNLDSLKILNRLAELGEPIAQDGMATALYFNTLYWDDFLPIQQMTIEERVDGLKNLAFIQKSSRAQDFFGALCKESCLGSKEPVSLTDEQRRVWMKQLRKNEVGCNFYVCLMIAENAIGELPLNLSLEERFEILYARARQRFSYDFNTLLHAFLDNRLGKDKLNLSQEERLNKLRELRKIDPKSWDESFAKIYGINRGGASDDFFEPNFSDKERIAWLDEQATTQDNESAQRIMVDYYLGVRQTLDLIATNINIMPLRERITKLFILAYKDNLKAQSSLLSFFSVYHFEHTIKIIVEKKHKISKRANWLTHIFKWSLLGGVDMQDLFINLTPSSVSKITLEYLYNMRRVVSHIR